MKSTNTRKFLVSSLLAQMVLVGSAYGQTAVSWDAGAGANTLTSNATNWNPNAVPAFGATVQATMTTGGTASVDNAMAFGPTTTPTPALQFGGNFNLGDGGGSVTLYGSSSGQQPVLRTNGSASAVTIAAPLRVFSTSPSASPLGNLLVLNVNNTTASNTALNITGGISLASGSTASSYDLRIGNGNGGTTGASARISGPVTGLATVANANAIWNGKLIFAGNHTLSSTNVSIGNGSGFGNPTSSAQLVLGDSASDIQTWNNITLNNVMNVVAVGNISAGSITLGNSTAMVTVTGNLTSTGTVSTTVAGGKFVGGAASPGNLSLSGGTINSNATIGGAGANQNSLNLIKVNAGTLNLSSAHTYNGTTTVNGGTLNLGTGTTLATSGITVNNGGTLNIASTGITASVLVNAGGILSGEGNSGALSFGNGISTFNFDPATGGAFTASSYSANAGALVLLTPSSSTTLGTPYLVLTSTGGFGASVPSEFAASARGNLSLGGGNTTISFTPTAAASLVWKGNVNGNWDVVSTQNWTNNATADRFYANDSVTFNDSALTGNVSVTGSAVSVGSVTFDNSTQNYVLSGLGITSAGALTKSGSGNVTVGNTVTAAGVSVSGGNLVLNASASLGANDITVSGGALTLGAANTATGNISVSGGGTLNATVGTNATTGSLGSFAAARTVSLNNGTLNYGGSTISSDNISLNVAGESAVGVGNAAATLRVGGTFSGAGNLTVSGPGVFALGRNTADASWGSGYSGNIAVNSGAVLSLRNEQSLGSTSGSTTIKDGGTLMFDPFSQTSLTLAAESIAFQGNSTLSNRLNGQPSLTTTVSGPVSTSGNLLINMLGGNTTLNINGDISGAGGVSFGGASTVSGLSAATGGTYNLNGNSTYTGATAINSGTVNLNGSLGNTTITVNGGTFKLGAASSLGATSTVIVNSGSFDTSALVGGFTVAVGQTIKGSGTYTGAVTVNGTLAPGNSPGVLTFADNLTLVGTTSMEINGTARGTQYDGINLTGTASNTLTYGGTLTLSFGAPVEAGTYDLFALGSVVQTGDFTSVGATGANVASLSGLSITNGTGWTANLTDTLAQTWSLTFVNSTGDLTITAIPEPSAYAALAGFGVIGVALYRRRRQTVSK
jgi:autotransporter-associated beta strand protein